MKDLKYFAFVVIIATMLTACDPSRNNATLGNSSDTSSVAGVKDTSRTQADSTEKDSASDGNADPTGHIKN